MEMIQCPIALKQIYKASMHVAEQDVLQWWPRCTIHHTWMQASIDPCEHWRCEVEGCAERRAAKMRTSYERRIFWTVRKMESDAKKED